jgi:hypothetical protein
MVEALMTKGVMTDEQRNKLRENHFKQFDDTQDKTPVLKYGQFSMPPTLAAGETAMFT